MSVHFQQDNKDLRKHPYKIQTRHALEPGDPARRLRFCNWLLQMPQRTLAETCIVDESNFYMNGTVSRQNIRRYADRNNPPRNFVYNKPNDVLHLIPLELPFKKKKMKWVIRPHRYLRPSI